MSSRDRPVLLFATIAAGGGHVATARAMSEAVERYYPGQFGLRVSDYMKDVGITGFDQAHKNVWNRVSRYPILARGGQRIIDAFPRLTIAGQRRILNGFARAAAADLGAAPPLLVISNHGLITTGLAVSKRRYGLEVPVLTFATEPHNISAYWADPQADHIVVPSEEVRRDLLRLGVPASKMSVVSYPVRQAFLNAPSKAEARVRLGLEHRFTCLISLGGEGVGGNPRRLVRALVGSDHHLQVMVITGRNRALRSKLQGLRLGPDRVRIEGFVNDMSTYLAASDVVVGKAGPASVYEALAVHRPVLVTSYVGLNERAVARFVERQGLGYHVKTPKALLEIVRCYASNPTLLEDAAWRCRRLDLEAKTERLAHYIVRYARAGTTGTRG